VNVVNPLAHPGPKSTQKKCLGKKWKWGERDRKAGVISCWRRQPNLFKNICLKCWERLEKPLEISGNGTS
jgi:hypothetical protein